VANVKGGIINPNATNSLVIFLIGSIIAGFAAGLGWGLASKMIESTNNQVSESFKAKKIRAMRARARAMSSTYMTRPRQQYFSFHLA
jgi:hypothetical protein